MTEPTYEYQAIAKDELTTREYVLRRRTLEELQAAVDVYRGFGYQVTIQRREVGLWVNVEALP